MRSGARRGRIWRPGPRAGGAELDVPADTGAVGGRDLSLRDPVGVAQPADEPDQRVELDGGPRPDLAAVLGFDGHREAVGVLVRVGADPGVHVLLDDAFLGHVEVRLEVGVVLEEVEQAVRRADRRVENDRPRGDGSLGVVLGQWLVDSERAPGHGASSVRGDREDRVLGWLVRRGVDARLAGVGGSVRGGDHGVP